jgi:16S rRNA (cytosine967-C5)-methyltransferase
MTTGPSPVSAARLAAWRRLAESSISASRPVPPEDDDGGSDARRDRALANRLARGVLRHRALLDALLHREKLFDPRKTPPALHWVLRLAAFEKIFQSGTPDYAIGAQAVELAREVAGERAARFVNAIVRRLVAALPESFDALRAGSFWAALPDEVRWSTPQPILQAFIDAYGAAAAREVVRALSETEAPVWLRVNRLRATPDAVQARLNEAGVAVEAAASLPEALRWRGGEALPWSTAPWARGELTVQDLGAMLAAPLLAPAPGSAVLDLCAAPGGKTGHLWEWMGGRGRLVALERDPDRRQLLGPLFSRLYGPDHGIEIPDWEPFASRPEPVFDRVLIDAPCLALGLIRRHPEARWDDRLRHRARMESIQADLLDQGASFVRPGGRLLWATCSPTRFENETVLQSWLARHPNWHPRDPASLLGAAWVEGLQIEGPVVRTRPDRLDCDGFAYILIERSGD